MKRTIILLTLLVSAPAGADTFTFSINEAKTLAKLPEICVLLRSKLPPKQRTPWNANQCAKQLALHGARNIYNSDEARLGRDEMNARNRAARTAVVTTPTPTASPSPTP